MSVASPVKSEPSAEPLFGLPPIPWPDGTTWFAFRTWIALAIGFYAAFFLELEGASSAGVCILILAQPVQGMVLSKAIYRFAGTIVGVFVAVTMTALFPQDRVMLVASFAVFMGLQTALGTALRDFRSYGCILAGYTVAIISIANIDDPTATFEAAVNRVAAIVVGIAAIGFTNAFLATEESSKSLMSKLRTAAKDVIALASQALDNRAAPSGATCVDLAARLMPLRSEISFATPEKPDGRLRAKGARSALLGLLEMINAIQAVGGGLAHLDAPSPIIDEALVILRRALRVQNPEKHIVEIEALAAPRIAEGTLSISEAHVLDRITFMIETLASIRDGLRSLRTGFEPRRDVALPVHQDWFAVGFNAVRVIVAVVIVAVASILTGLPQTTQAVLFTAVFVSLGSTLPDPNVMGRAAVIGMPAVVVAGAVYAFFIFPNIDGYPLFILSVVPLVVIMCWLIKIGMAGAGLIFTVQVLVLIAPANTQVIDPPAFVDLAAMLTYAGVAIFLSFILILPVDPAARRLRLVLAGGDNLRRALRDESRLEQPRASLHYDRLSQFKTWQWEQDATLARRKSMKRLVDIGNLAYAVRRSWRALDRSAPYIDPSVDAKARKVLPSLSPEETIALASAYLAAAHGKQPPAALSLAHCAAALYGTALVTNDELRLLNRVELLRRRI